MTIGPVITYSLKSDVNALSTALTTLQGTVATNTSNISSKLTRVESSQSVQKVYGVDTDGSNLLLDYPVALPTTSRTLPTFNVAYSLVTGSAISTPFNQLSSPVIPSTGEVFPNGNLRSEYSFLFPNTDTTNIKRCSTQLSFGYPNYNGLATQCTLKYVGDYYKSVAGHRIHSEVVTGYVSNGTVYFTPLINTYESQTNTITVLELTF